VRNFTPSWFSVTMGTGVLSILLHTIPFATSNALHYASIVFFILNACLFAIALALSLARYILYPEIWTVMIRDPVNSLFLGTLPMGFATLVHMWLLVCVPVWGSWAVTAAFAMWVVDAVVAVATTLALPMMLMCRNDISSLDRFTATQLIPIAATVVAAGVGARVAAVLESPTNALGVVVTCYVLWGMSVPFAFMILTLYYHRLVVHKLPPREVIVSAFLPLGPCGYSANM
jgi:tellurite resistance protein TehA-like permease